MSVGIIFFVNMSCLKVVADNFGDRVGADFLKAVRENISRAPTVRESFINRRFNRLSRRIFLETVAQEHRRAKNRSHRICKVFTGNIGRGVANRFIKARKFAINSSY